MLDLLLPGFPRSIHLPSGINMSRKVEMRLWLIRRMSGDVASRRRRCARTYITLRHAGERIGNWLRPIVALLRVVARMWPVSFVWFALTLCFLLPGLANSQTFEAMLEYAGGGGQAGVRWTRLLVTALVAMSFGSVMAASAGDLLRSGIADAKVSRLGLHIISFACRWFPTAVLAIAFYTMQSVASGSLYPYRVMALVLIILQIGCKLLARAARKRGLILSSNTMSRTRRDVLAFASVLLAILFFGAADKDSWIGIPISSIAVAQALGPINVLMMFLSAFLVLTTVLVRLGRLLHLSLVGILIGLTFGFSWYDLNDNHIIRQAQEGTTKAQSVEDAFDEWMGSRPDKDGFDEYPVILVSAEGGGIRAAFFTAVTLARIADRCPRMVNHIFAVSGVSGGAVGAALFAAALKAWPVDTKDRRCDLKSPASPIYEDALAQVLQDDHLSPLFARMLFPDAAQQALPFPIASFDRQLGLEFSLERSFRRVFGQDLMSQSIYNLRPNATSPAIPYLFLNTTEVQSGRRFVITPLFLQSQPFGGAQDWHWLDWDHGPPLSAAAGVSARFPVFSPAGYFFNNGRKARYVDGGYIDNSGTVTLGELFNALYLLREEKYLEDYKGAKTTKFAMTALHIGNAPACDVIKDESVKRAGAQEPPRCDPNEQAPPAGGLGELLSPLDAVLGVREAQVEYNLYQFHNHIDLGTDLNRFDFHARVQMYDRGIPVPLGWLLSTRVAAELRSQLDARPGEPDCRKQVHDSNLCELVGVVAGASWEK